MTYSPLLNKSRFIILDAIKSGELLWISKFLLAFRPLRTSNSNDKRLIALCFVVIAKNNSPDCFCTLLFKSALSVICLKGFVGTKCRNSGTSMLAYVSEAPAWRWQGSVPYTMAQVQSTKSQFLRQEHKKREAGICSCISQDKSATICVCLAQCFGHR